MLRYIHVRICLNSAPGLHRTRTSVWLPVAQHNEKVEWVLQYYLAVEIHGSIAPLDTIAIIPIIVTRSCFIHPSAMSGSTGSNKMGALTDDSRSEDGDGTSSERGAQQTMCLTSDEVNYLIFRYVSSEIQDKCFEGSFKLTVLFRLQILARIRICS